ncbi:YHS domain-containing (seleno)protein [Labrys okinawensis]|uniref:YHS domain-containing (seleno)protein n=1 Tax=Labrys okinawensis TaxID=346911 RepID=UPI0039BD65D4
MRFQSKVKAAAVMAVFAAVTISPDAFAGEIYSANGVAISGYDPISYFTDHRAVKGSDQFTANYNGATFRFASADHRDIFLKDPTHYAPQYGGFCAYGTAEGHKVPTDPQAFTVIGDKLYLNYNLDVRKKWRQDPSGYITQADKNWSAVKAQQD